MIKIYKTKAIDNGYYNLKAWIRTENLNCNCLVSRATSYVLYRRSIIRRNHNNINDFNKAIYYYYSKMIEKNIEVDYFSLPSIESTIIDRVISDLYASILCLNLSCKKRYEAKKIAESYYKNEIEYLKKKV